MFCNVISYHQKQRSLMLSELEKVVCYDLVQKTNFLQSTKIIHLDQTAVFVVIQVFPCAFFPVPMRHQTRCHIPALPFLSAWALNTSFSLYSLQSWRSRWSSQSHGSLISVSTITSIPPGYPWGTRLAMCAGRTCATEGSRLKIKRQFRLLVRYGKHVKGLIVDI